MVAFREVTELFQKIDDISSRLEMMELLGNFYKETTPEEASILSYLLLGRLAPMFVSSEFNFSEKSIENVLASYVLLEGLDLDVVQLRNTLGDVGLVAEKVSRTIGGDYKGKISLIEAYSELWSLMNLNGGNSVSNKSALFLKLFKNLDPISNKYFAKIISGKMRLGASVNTIIESLSFAKVGDKSVVENLKQSYGTFADIGLLSYKVIVGSDVSSVMPVTLGIPVKARLVERVKSFDEVFERLGDRVMVQPKFDGLRCQAHVGVNEAILKDQISEALWLKYDINEDENDSLGMFSDVKQGVSEDSRDVRLFSRNLESLTDMFPEIVDTLKSLDCKSCILDGEIEGVDMETGRFLNFQETITRKRKYGVEEAVNKVPVKYYIFDIIELDGEDLTELDTVKRTKILKNLLKKKPDLIELAETWIVKDIIEIQKYFDNSVGDGLEGLVVKQLTGGYKPGVRNYEWLKLKKSMDKSLVDSVDIVIMGYYYGSGKKAELGIGALLGGVLNRDTGKVESITKVGTGFTDELWNTIIVRLSLLEIKEMPKQYMVTKEMAPDVWVQPEVVCSVESDEVTKSKLHKAGFNSKTGLGYALRFPRMIEFDRDKDFTEATSVEELVKMAWDYAK